MKKHRMNMLLAQQQYQRTDTSLSNFIVVMCMERTTVSVGNVILSKLFNNVLDGLRCFGHCTLLYFL